MRQVFNNLIDNAIKFTPSKGRVEISVVSQKNKIFIEVKDTGVGIAPEFLPHIFERFSQGSSDINTKQGLGIGLPLVRDFIHLHGGTIETISSGLNLGTTFIINLPKLLKYE